MKQEAIIVPEGCTLVLLHACCAPCSSAIVEWLLAHQIEPVIYYYNPNIYPQEEYEIRKNESKRHAESLGIQWIDDDRMASGGEQQCDDVRCTKDDVRCTKDDVRCTKENYNLAHEAWRHDICRILEEQQISHPELEPERGKRCEACFYHRLLATARKAQELGIPFFATTLASSRWKNLEQVNAAGEAAASRVQNTEYRIQTDSPNIRFWAQNWRKGGLQDRRNQLLKEYEFYNQTYCGCEFSRPLADRDDRMYRKE